MGQTLPIYFSLFLLSLLGCDSNLKITTQGGEGGGASNFRILLDQTIVSETDVSIAWSGVDAASTNLVSSVSYELLLARDDSCADVIQSYKDITTQSQTVSFTQDGIYYLCLHAVLPTGKKLSADNNGIDLTVDREPPVIVSESANLLTDKPAMLNPEVSDLTKLSFLWEKVSGVGAVNFSDPTASNPIITMTQSGTYVLRLTVTDAAGNYSQKEFTVEWEAAPNAAAIVGAPTGLTNQTAVTATILGLGLTHYKYKITTEALCDSSG